MHEKYLHVKYLPKRHFRWNFFMMFNKYRYEKYHGNRVIIMCYDNDSGIGIKEEGEGEAKGMDEGNDAK